MTITLRRGDRRTLTLSGLLDAAGAPATLVVGDRLRWTVKLRTSQADVDALITKTSPSGGITFTPGTGVATVTILPADWTDITFPVSQAFLWDMQIELNGDVTQVVTLASGDGVIEPDVGLTVP